MAIEQLDIEEAPHKWKWDGTISSPQKLYRALGDIVEDLAYKIDPGSSKSLELESVPVAESASFEGKIIGQKKTKRWSWVKLIVGIVLVLVAIPVFMAGITGHKESYTYTTTHTKGLIFKKEYVQEHVGTRIFYRGLEIAMILAGPLFFVVGCTLTARSWQRRGGLLIIGIEGESYKATLAKDEAQTQMGRAGIISDVRVTVRAGVTTFAFKKWKSDPGGLMSVEQDFESIKGKLETLLPTFTLPGIG